MENFLYLPPVSRLAKRALTRRFYLLLLLSGILGFVTLFLANLFVTKESDLFGYGYFIPAVGSLSLTGLFVVMNCFGMVTHCVPLHKLPKPSYVAYLSSFVMCVLFNVYFYAQFESIAGKSLPSSTHHFLCGSMLSDMSMIGLASIIAYYVSDKFKLISLHRYDVVLSPTPSSIWESIKVCVVSSFLPAQRAALLLSIVIGLTWSIALLCVRNGSFVWQHFVPLISLLWSMEFLLWAVFMSLYATREILKLVLLFPLDFSILQEAMNKETALASKSSTLNNSNISSISNSSNSSGNSDGNLLLVQAITFCNLVPETQLLQSDRNDYNVSSRISSANRSVSGGFGRSESGSNSSSSALKVIGSTPIGTSNAAISSTNSIFGSSSLNSFGIDQMPLWKQILLIHQRYAEKLLLEIKPTTSPGYPILSPFRNINVTSYADHIVRLLAFQDFHRLASAIAPSLSSSTILTSSTKSIALFHTQRRRALFAGNGAYWCQLAHACIGLIDATTLQIQLAIAYGLEEVLPQLESEWNSSANKLSVERLNNETAHRWKYENGNWTALEIIQTNKKLRDETMSNKTKENNLLQLIFLSKNFFTNFRFNFMNSINKYIFRIDLVKKLNEIEADPIPVAVIQSVIFSIEGITLCLEKALVEDSKSFSIHFVPSIISSLCALSITIADHCDIVRRYCLLHSTSVAISSTSSLSSSYSRNQQQKGLPTFPLSTTTVHSSMSTSMIALQNAVEEGLARVIRAYRDQLSRYTFPVQYSAIIEKHLSNRNI